MGRRILNDALRTIVNAEKRGKATAELKPISSVMSAFLQIMKTRGNQSIYQFLSCSLILRFKRLIVQIDSSKIRHKLEMFYESFLHCLQAFGCSLI